MRQKSLLINTVLMTALAVVMLDAEAAVATAKVSVKVVPATSFHITKRIAMSIPADNETDIQQAQTAVNQIEISSLNNKTAVTVKTDGNQNTVYDLSISSESTLTGSSSADTITINDMKVNRQSTSLTDDNEREVLIDGKLAIPDSLNTGAYSGTTEITVNYN